MAVRQLQNRHNNIPIRNVHQQTLRIFFSKSKRPFRLSTDLLSAKMRELKHNVL